MMEIVEYARSCLGTPFHHQGRVPGVGMDCGGLVVAIAEHLGAEYVDLPGYGREPNQNMLIKLLDSQPCLERVPNSQIAPGDILVFRFAKEGQHLGVYTGSSIIHAFSKVGKCVENGFDRFWSSRLSRAYRFVTWVS